MKQEENWIKTKSLSIFIHHFSLSPRLSQKSFTHSTCISGLPSVTSNDKSFIISFRVSCMHTITIGVENLLRFHECFDDKMISKKDRLVEKFDMLIKLVVFCTNVERFWRETIVQIFCVTLNLVTWQASDCLVTLDSICPFPLVSSQLFARGMNLDWPIRAQSGTWSSRVSNSCGRRTRFTPVGLPYGRIFSQVFCNKKWLCDHLGGFVWRVIYLALWKYDFYDVSLLPIVIR